MAIDTRVWTGSSLASAYAVLGVAPPASQRELRSAYRQLVRRLHPDTNGGSRSTEPWLEAVREAYGTISRARAGSASQEAVGPTARTWRPGAGAARMLRSQLLEAYSAGIPRSGPQLVDVLVA